MNEPVDSMYSDLYNHFKEFLEVTPPEQIVGIIRARNSCPLYNYMHTIDPYITGVSTYSLVRAEPTEFQKATFDGQTLPGIFSVTIPSEHWLPTWAKDFVRAVDRLDTVDLVPDPITGSECGVNAAKALEILNGIAYNSESVTNEATS